MRPPRALPVSGSALEARSLEKHRQISRSAAALGGTESAIPPRVTKTTSAEQSLINDTEFLGELEGSAHVTPPRPDGLFDPRPMYDDAFDALDGGLPMRAGARGTSEPFQQRQQNPPPIAQACDEEPIAPQPPARHMSFAAAALVIIACLTAGAATAAIVFHDRLTAVTAALTASR